jgi:Zn-dependent metalloprotease
MVRECLVRGRFPMAGGAGRPVGDRVRSFLASRSHDLPIGAWAVDLRLIDQVTTPIRRILRYEQTRNGVPIVGAIVLVQLDLADNVRRVDVPHDPALPVAAPCTDTELTPECALQVALDDVGPATLRVQPRAGRRVYYPAGGALRLACEALVCTADPTHEYRYIVDAYSGAILAKDDLLAEFAAELPTSPTPQVRVVHPAGGLTA